MLYIVPNENHDATIYYKKEYLPAGVAYFCVDSIPQPESGADILTYVLKADVAEEKIWYEYVYKTDIIAQKDSEIDKQVVDKIREKYDENEEMKMLRLGVLNPQDENFVAYDKYIEECREWGRKEKEKIQEEVLK